MAYVSKDPEKWQGQCVGSGQCVAYVREASGAPHTSTWRRGAMVQGNPSIVPGTVIATFDKNGSYGNHTDGSSHAAIYLRQDAEALHVLDQWTGHPVSERPIHFRSAPRLENDGRSYYVVE